LGYYDLFHFVHRIDLIGETGVFTAYVAYITHNCIESYNSGSPDHLGHATEFFLDFINILNRMLEIIKNFK
jgi:FtsH-binding integral membrane protein